MKKIINISAVIFVILLSLFNIAERILKYYLRNYYRIEFNVFAMELLFIIIVIVHAILIVFTASKILQIFLFIPIVPTLIIYSTSCIFVIAIAIYIIAYVVSKQKYKKTMASIIGIYAALNIVIIGFLYFVFLDPHISYPKEEHISPDGKYVVVIEKREFDDGRDNETYIRYYKNEKKDYVIFKLLPKDEWTLDSYLNDNEDNKITWISDNKFRFGEKQYVLNS